MLKAEQLNSRDLVQNETPRKWEETGVSHNGPLDIKIPYTPLKVHFFTGFSPSTAAIWTDDEDSTPTTQRKQNSLIF